jgi:hypothetical protein
MFTEGDTPNRRTADAAKLFHELCRLKFLGCRGLDRGTFGDANGGC